MTTYFLSIFQQHQVLPCEANLKNMKRSDMGGFLKRHLFNSSLKRPRKYSFINYPAICIEIEKKSYLKKIVQLSWRNDVEFQVLSVQRSVIYFQEILLDTPKVARRVLMSAASDPLIRNAVLLGKVRTQCYWKTVARNHAPKTMFLINLGLSSNLKPLTTLLQMEYSLRTTLSSCYLPSSVAFAV